MKWHQGRKELESTDRFGIGRWQRKRIKDGERTWRKETVDVGSETEEWRGWLYGPNKKMGTEQEVRERRGEEREDTHALAEEEERKSTELG